MVVAKTRKLKVYQAPFGFYDSVVAAPNQGAALRAWGSRQNLFAEGIAHVINDQKAIEAALAYPEIPLRRPIGSTGLFELEPTEKPKSPKLPKNDRKSGTAPSAKPEPAAPPPADRSELDEAEASLKQLETRWVDRKSEFARRREEIDADEASARQSYREDRKLRQRVVATAERAYFRAGGKD